MVLLFMNAVPGNLQTMPLSHDARQLFDLGTVRGVERSSKKLGVGSSASEWFILLRYAQDGRLLKYLGSRRVDRTDFVITLIDSIDDESRSDTVHVQALQILDEWSVLLLQEPIDPNEIISKLIQKCTTMNSDRLILKSKLISTITSLAITHQFINKSFRQFIHLNMLSVIAKNDGLESALLRRNVCYCLMELETTFPGLLSHKIGHIYSIAKAQKTFAAQGYIQLLSLVLRNACACIRVYNEQPTKPANILKILDDGLVTSHHLSVQGLLATDAENFTSFLFPADMLDTPLFLNSILGHSNAFSGHDVTKRHENKHQYSQFRRSTRFLKEKLESNFEYICATNDILQNSPHLNTKVGGEDPVQRCISYIVDSAPMCSAPSTVQIMHHVCAVVMQTTLSQQSFHISTKRMELSIDICDMHSVVMLMSMFRNRRLLRSKDITSIRVRFLDLLTDFQVPQWRRQLLIAICFGNPSLLGMDVEHLRNLSVILKSIRRVLWTQKVDVLASILGEQAEKSFSATDNSDSHSSITDVSIRIEVLADTGSISTLTQEQCVAILHDALSDVVDFGIIELFRAVFRIIIHAQDVIVKDISTYSLQLVEKHTALLPYLVHVITAASVAKNDASLAISVLSALQDRFVAVPVHTLSYDLDEYLAVLLRVASIPSIRPAAFLLRLKDVLLQTNVCRKGEWNRGHRILEICRCVMQHHDISEVSGGYLASILDTSLDALEQDRIEEFLPSKDSNQSSQHKDVLHQAPHQLLILRRNDEPKRIRRKTSSRRSNPPPEARSRFSRKLSGMSLERLLQNQQLNAATPTIDENESPWFPSLSIDEQLRQTLEPSQVLSEYAAHLNRYMADANIQVPCRLIYEVAPGVAKIAKCPDRLFAIELSLHDP
eukprot:gene4359-6646_t